MIFTIERRYIASRAPDALGLIDVIGGVALTAAFLAILWGVCALYFA